MKRRYAHFALLAFLAAGWPLHSPAQQSTPPKSDPAASPTQPVLLDRVVAIVNGDVLLESDVQEEGHFARLEPIGVPSGSDSSRRAAQRLISRTLILQQIKEQQLAAVNVASGDIENQLAELRKTLPECRQYDCTTPSGWKEFLAANSLSEQDVDEHWKQRIQILRFIDIRFRAGIRIPKQEVADYYQKSIVPGYEHGKNTPPSIESLTPRIQEVLLQQHVNGLLRDWLRTLRQEGSVQILDPAYGQSSGVSPDEDD